MDIKKAVLLIIVFYVLGIFSGNAITRHFEIKNLWDIDRNGLSDLNMGMAKDKTQRLGLAVITEKATYAIQSIDSREYQMFAGFKKVGGNS